MDESLGSRMKRYEVSTQMLLPHRQPTIIRVDGRAFHTVTRHMGRPYDRHFQDLMNDTALHLAKNIQTAVHLYWQSDEISLILHPFPKHTTEPWFGNNVQKMVSVSAALAASYFTHVFGSIVEFDSRVFILPQEEVLNYLIWRQQDARRNSVQMLARSLYSHNELIGKKESDMFDMIRAKGCEWTDYPIRSRYGASLNKVDGTWEKVYPNYLQLVETDYIERLFAHE